MPTPAYLDWKFWSAIVALLALVLSQLPPLHLWFRPRRLERMSQKAALLGRAHTEGWADLSRGKA